MRRGQGARLTVTTWRPAAISAGLVTAAGINMGRPNKRLVLDDFRKATAAAFGLAEFLAPAA